MNIDDEKKSIEELNSLLRNHLFFDFHAYEYKPYKLIIAGNTDLTYSHELEITFIDPTYFYGSFGATFRTSPDKKDVLSYLSLEEHLSTYSYCYCEVGYTLYKLSGDDSDIIIAARSVEIRWNTVLYYNPSSGISTHKM